MGLTSSSNREYSTRILWIVIFYGNWTTANTGAKHFLFFDEMSVSQENAKEEQHFMMADLIRDFNRDEDIYVFFSSIFQFQKGVNYTMANEDLFSYRCGDELLRVKFDLTKQSTGPFNSLTFDYTLYDYESTTSSMTERMKLTQAVPFLGEDPVQVNFEFDINAYNDRIGGDFRISFLDISQDPFPDDGKNATFFTELSQSLLVFFKEDCLLSFQAQKSDRLTVSFKELKITGVADPSWDLGEKGIFIYGMLIILADFDFRLWSGSVPFVLNNTPEYFDPVLVTDRLSGSNLGPGVYVNVNDPWERVLANRWDLQNTCFRLNLSNLDVVRNKQFTFAMDFKMYSNVKTGSDPDNHISILDSYQTLRNRHQYSESTSRLLESTAELKNNSDSSNQGIRDENSMLFEQRILETKTPNDYINKPQVLMSIKFFGQEEFIQILQTYSEIVSGSKISTKVYAVTKKDTVTKTSDPSLECTFLQSEQHYFELSQKELWVSVSENARRKVIVKLKTFSEQCTPNEVVFLTDLEWGYIESVTLGDCAGSRITFKSTQESSHTIYDLQKFRVFSGSYLDMGTGLNVMFFNQQNSPVSVKEDVSGLNLMIGEQCPDPNCRVCDKHSPADCKLCYFNFRLNTGSCVETNVDGSLTYIPALGVDVADLIEYPANPAPLTVIQFEVEYLDVSSQVSPQKFYLNESDHVIIRETAPGNNPNLIDLLVSRMQKNFYIYQVVLINYQSRVEVKGMKDNPNVRILGGSLQVKFFDVNCGEFGSGTLRNYFPYGYCDSAKVFLESWDYFTNSGFESNVATFKKKINLQTISSLDLYFPCNNACQCDNVNGNLCVFRTETGGKCDSTLREELGELGVVLPSERCEQCVNPSCATCRGYVCTSCAHGFTKISDVFDLYDANSTLMICSNQTFSIDKTFRKLFPKTTSYNFPLLNSERLSETFGYPKFNPRTESKESTPLNDSQMCLIFYGYCHCPVREGYSHKEIKKYYSLFGVCEYMRCSPGCVKCDSDQNCLKCKNPLFQLDSGKCVKIHPTSAFKQKSIRNKDSDLSQLDPKQLLQPALILNCQSQVGRKCSQCYTQFYLTQNKCVRCPENSKICRKRGYNSLNLAFGIIECVPGNVISKKLNKCFKKIKKSIPVFQLCEESYFYDFKTLSCRRCPKNCKWCQDLGHCLRCYPKFALNFTKKACIPECGTVTHSRSGLEFLNDALECLPCSECEFCEEHGKPKCPSCLKCQPTCQFTQSYKFDDNGALVKLISSQDVSIKLDRRVQRENPKLDFESDWDHNQRQTLQVRIRKNFLKERSFKIRIENSSYLTKSCSLPSPGLVFEFENRSGSPNDHSVLLSVLQVAQNLKNIVPVSAGFLGSRASSLILLINMNRILEFGIDRDISSEGVVSFSRMLQIKNYQPEVFRTEMDLLANNSNNYKGRFYAFMNSTQKFTGSQFVRIWKMITILLIFGLNLFCRNYYINNKKVILVSSKLRKHLPKIKEDKRDLFIELVSKNANISEKRIRYWMGRPWTLAFVRLVIFFVGRNYLSNLINLLLSNFLPILEELLRLVIYLRQFPNQSNETDLLFGLIQSFLLSLLVSELIQEYLRVKQYRKKSQIKRKKEALAKLGKCLLRGVFYVAVVFPVVFLERFFSEYQCFICCLISLILLTRSVLSSLKKSFWDDSLVDVLVLVFFFGLYVNATDSEGSGSHQLIDFFYCLINIVFIGDVLWKLKSKPSTQ